jgi:hypothetical protein
MFLTLEEDGCVHVWDTPEAAAFQIEALDVEGSVWKAYDDQARPYRVDWLKPNRYGKALFFLSTAINGEYRFVAAGPPEPSGLLEMLREAREVLPESAADQVRDLERRLAER